jgi:hypothetical protein
MNKAVPKISGSMLLIKGASIITMDAELGELSCGDYFDTLRGFIARH